jgi:glycyl-tRNA synthetase (class II)
MTVGDAVAQGVIANETLGYFVARIHSFLLRIGIDPARLRFRQHMANEMAHYAADCWDAEIKNSVGGWTECVGCADRAAYDLSVHSAKTGHPLVVRQALKEPIVEERAVAEWDKKALGKTFKGEAGAVTGAVEALDEAGLMRLKGELEQGYVVSPHRSDLRTALMFCSQCNRASGLRRSRRPMARSSHSSPAWSLSSARRSRRPVCTPDFRYFRTLTSSP